MHMRIILVGAAVSALFLRATAAPAAPPPYKDDPEIVRLLDGLGDNTAATLPYDRKNEAHRGRSGNDYSMRMAYAPERQTALYAGGNHNDGRRNDCWEHHLGSNSWHRLFPDEGGDHYFLKGIVMFRMREFEAKNKTTAATATLDDFRSFLKEEDRRKLDEQIIPWWKKNIVMRDGMLVTPGGGPIMPSHTWDGLTYDPVRKRMLWSAGAGPNGECFNFHRMVHGMTAGDVVKFRDPRHTPMWEFDPAAGKWNCYRRPATGPCPDFRGMGQSLEYVPDQRKFLWYVAASNVSPHSYQMWSFDPAGDAWTELHPNGGKSVRELVHRLKLAPDGEQVIRYSTNRKKLYAFKGPDVFTYDVARDEWAKVCTDTRIDAHDADVMIAWDSINDVFIHTRKTVKGSLVRLAVFDPAKDAWEVPEIKGAPLPDPQYARLKGYFHPVHNVYVIAPAGGTPTWVYRWKRKPA